MNPLAIRAMKELNIDISRNKTKSVFDFYRAGELFQYVISVCDEAAERCPIFPGHAVMIQWSFEDPSGFTGTVEERLEKTRRVRDEIRTRVESWANEVQDE